MLSRSLRRTVTVLLVAAMLVVGSTVAAYGVEENTFTASVDQVEAACADSAGAFFESDDGTYGVCIYEGGLSMGCDDIAIEGEDNCWVMQERKVPKKMREEFNEFKVAVGGLEPAGKPPKRVRILVDALELVAEAGYCDRAHSRRTQMLLESLTIALLEGDRGLDTCGSAEQPSPAPPRGGGSPDTSPSTSPSTTSPPDTTTTTQEEPDFL